MNVTADWVRNHIQTHCVNVSHIVEAIDMEIVKSLNEYSERVAEHEGVCFWDGREHIWTFNYPMKRKHDIVLDKIVQEYLDRGFNVKVYNESNFDESVSIILSISLVVGMDAPV